MPARVENTWCRAVLRRRRGIRYDIVYNAGSATTTLCFEAFKMTTATANANVPYPDQDTAAAVACALAAANDRLNPVLDASRSAQKYAGMAQDFRASAWEHLA